KGVCEDYYEEDDDQILFNSNRFDKNGLWQNSLIFEITYDSVLKDRDTAMRKGLYVSGSLEYAPRLAINDFRGEADFIKYAFELRYFVPVVKFDEDNLLAGVYFGTSFLWDYIEGDKIPLYARQHITSTLSTTAALGGLVRGYEKYRFDSELKWASRNEFRFNTRKFHITDVNKMDVFLRFSALGFFDFGYYGTTDGDDGDMICSSGAGVLASFMDILSVSMYLAWPMAEKRLDGYRVVPVFGFGFKF
ncbi:MAG: hypothetical protein MJ215_07235, partial [Spirochaetia bacterium]|nr:hypothetical protein [Spirochaetia bacterium]